MSDLMRFADRAIDTAKEASVLRREHELKLANAGGRSRMAEIERTETGATRRRSMQEAGLLARSGLTETGISARSRATEAGLESRHLRQYGPESISSRESGLRYGEGGVEDRKLEQSASRSQGMNDYQQANVDQAGEAFQFEKSQAELKFVSDRLEEKFSHMTSKGQQPTPNLVTMESAKINNDWIKAHYSGAEAKEMIAQNPVELRRNDKTGEETWYNAFGEPILSPPQQQGAEGTEPPPPLPPGSDETLPPGAGEVATRLRRDYEKENAAPIIGSRTLGAFKEKIKNRTPALPVEAPSRLQGYGGY